MDGIYHSPIILLTMNLNEILDGARKKNGESFSSNYHKTKISSPSSSSFSYIDNEDTQGSCSQPVYESKASQIEPQNANISEDDIELAVKRLISSEYNVPVEQLHSYTVLKDIVRGNIPMLCWKTEQAFNVNLAGKEKAIRTVGNLFNAVKRLNPSNIVDYQPDDDYDDDCEYIQKEGECSEIEVEGVSYEYDEDSGEVTLKIKRIENNSTEIKGTLKIVCWVSEYRLDDEWQNDNHHVIGEEVQGALDSNHSYKDIEAEFQLDSEDIPETRWHFVFTINELNEDGNWYIIDQRNGECHLTSSDINTFISIFVEKLGVDSDDLKYGSHLENDLCADELDKVEIIMELEKEFGIYIPDEEAEELQTVGDVINYLENIL